MSLHTSTKAAVSNQHLTSYIRNFSIIAHIDHGKTTLTDVLLRLTHTISPLNLGERIMDSNPIEKEKGVTIKLAPVRMMHTYDPATSPTATTATRQLPPAGEYMLNLIDTPGHVDFGYEVSRSLAACEGALLLIDASQGIQAQTVANYQKALDLGLRVIPVINKIDLPSADVEQTTLECLELLNCQEEDIVFVSAKTGIGVEKILSKIIEEIPAPAGSPEAPLRGLVITSIFDSHQGAIAYVRIVDGQLRKQQPLTMLASKTQILPVEIGTFAPGREPIELLETGHVGYIATGLKDVSLLKIGDTFTHSKQRDLVTALPGFREPTPMVYMDLYPIDAADYVELQDALGKLAIHDAALQYSATHSIALGNGYRVGFLGIFHAEVLRERLEREFDLDLIATAPSVPYQIHLTNGELLRISSPADLPDPSLMSMIEEPITHARIFCPEKYVGAVIKLAREKRGELINTLSAGYRTQLEYTLPLAELITDFHDLLKSLSSGYASIEYELAGYQPVDAVKVTVVINHEDIEALSFVAVRNAAEFRGRALVKKLKEVVPRQMFEVPIQAAIGGKIIARETIKAFRKDVTAKLYGGDVTRRMKLLRKQAKGKKRMKQIGKVQLNQETFLAVLGS